MEQLNIIGNLGRDAELKEANGRKFISFNVACNQYYKDQNGNAVEGTNWYSVTMPESKALEHLKKGSKVFVSGRPSSSIYRNKDGQPSLSLELRARDVKIIEYVKEENIA